MTERSRFWDGVATGDATEAPYDAPTEFAAVLRSLSGAAGVTTNLGGVFDNELNELAITGATSPVSVASGRALAYGNWYESDAAVNVAIPTPAASTRIDRIVLRKDWVAQTIRITRIAGVEGGAAPALVQIAGTTWDTPIAQASITTGGAITLTDQREFIPRANAAAHAHSSAVDGGDGPLTIADANYYSWLSANSPRMYRDAADVTALKRTTNAQAFRVYGTTTGPKYAAVKHDGTSATYGTPTGGGAVYIEIEAAHYWLWDTSGHYKPNASNTNDLGTAANTIRNIYAGTSVIAGASASASGMFIAHSSGVANGLRVYGAAGSHQWDIYLSGINIRIGDNTGGGVLVVDTGASFGANVSVLGDNVLRGFSKHKNADQSVNNSTTLVNDGALAGPVKANITYSFTIELPNVVEAAADMNFKAALDLPAGSVLQAWAVADGTIAAGNTYGQVSIEMVAEATGYVLTFGNAGAATTRIRITGYFTVGGSDGNAQFQFAQGTAIVGNLTIQSGATFDAIAVA